MKQIMRVESENPVQHVWQMLRFFLDVPSTAKEICEAQGITGTSLKRNVEKQAEQIGYCVRQAEEYFTASSKVSLATRPLLMYYGAVSLSRALILLKLDGSHSLDYLRTANKHKHHGLVISRGLVDTVRPNVGIQEFLGALQCTCFSKDADTPGAVPEPWGHFPLFYRSLTDNDYFPISFDRTSTNQRSAIFSGIRPSTGPEKRPLAELILKKLNGLTLVKALPDMSSFLREVSIEPDLCAGSCNELITYDYQANKLVKRVHVISFVLNNIDKDEKTRLVDIYTRQNPSIKVDINSDTSVRLILTAESDSDDAITVQYIPDAVSDIKGVTYYLLKRDEYLVEPAAYLVLLYLLGMVSRYYPDIWMALIDRNAMVAEMTNALLNTAYRKFPNLILDQLRRRMHLINPRV